MSADKINSEFRRVYIDGLFLPRCIECRAVSREKGVCLSVCLSVCQTRGLWRNEKKICPYERSFSLLYFSEKKTVGGERPLLPEILGHPECARAKSPIFGRYSLVAPQP